MRTASRLERILESGAFRCHLRVRASPGIRPRGHPREGRTPQGVCRCGQRDGQPDLGREDVLHRRVRHLEGDGARTDLPDDHPGPESYRHPERSSGRCGPGDDQPSLPLRRPSAIRRPSDRQECLRYRLHSADPHGPPDAGRGEIHQRGRDQGPPQVLHRCGCRTPLQTLLPSASRGLPRRRRQGWTSSRPSASTTWSNSRNG